MHVTARDAILITCLGREAVYSNVYMDTIHNMNNACSFNAPFFPSSLWHRNEREAQPMEPHLRQ